MVYNCFSSSQFVLGQILCNSVTVHINSDRSGYIMLYTIVQARRLNSIISPAIKEQVCFPDQRLGIPVLLCFLFIPTDIRPNDCADREPEVFCSLTENNFQIRSRSPSSRTHADYNKHKPPSPSPRPPV